MNNTQINAEIAKLKANKLIPEGLKAKRIEMLEKKLTSEEVEPKATEEKEEKSTTDKKPSKKKAVGKKAKFKKGTVVKINDKERLDHGQLATIKLVTRPIDGENTYTITRTDGEVVGAVESQLIKAKKQKAVVKYKGKNVDDLSADECLEMQKEVAARRRNQAKAEKKSKSRPVIEKVASNFATAAKQIINNIPAADIKEDPKGMITKMQKVETVFKNAISEVRTILGDDFDKETINDEFKDVHALIIELKKKYA